MICGIDEAGRGPLAGPVCAAAVVLPEDFPNEILNDSKKLNEKKRSAAAKIIYKKAPFWGIGWATNKEIDKLNILQATLLAMKRAFQSMVDAKTDFLQTMLNENQFKIIVDGNTNPQITCPKPENFLYNGDFYCETLVKADASIYEVMAASILAKTARDGLMNEMATLYPQYNYNKHKGYPTKEHIAKIKEFGPSPIQRYSFMVEGRYLQKNNN
ncbi:MAG: ribonuclease HII [Termitinemataceae bacterium]|nr:MAG: ribonuclease HII [Termitinemataceae bacterium]